jgi:hypothetical protein
VPCPSCSSSYLDQYGRCPACGFTGAPQPSGLYPVAYTAPTAPSGLSLATQVLIGISGLLALVAAAASTYGFTVSLSILDGSGNPENYYTQADVASALITVVVALVWIVNIATAVVFMIWFFKSAKLSAILAPGRQSLGPGWAIGGWFVPFAYLVLPRLVMGGIWRASEPVRDGLPATRRPRTVLVTFWWITFVLGQVGITVGGLSSSEPDRAFSDDRTVTVLLFLLALVVALLRVASSVLGVIMLRQVTARQQVRILQGPGAGHPYSTAVLGGYGQPQQMYAPPAAYAPQPYAAPQPYPQQPYAQPQPYIPTQPPYPPQPAAAPFVPPVPDLPPTAAEAAVPEDAVPQDAVPQDAVPADAVPATAVDLDKPSTAV